MSEKDIDMKIKLGVDYDPSGLEQAQKALQDFNSNVTADNLPAYALGYSGGITKHNLYQLEELEKSQEHNFWLEREHLKREKTAKKIDGAEYAYQIGLLSLEEKQARLQIAVYRAEIRLLEEREKKILADYEAENSDDKKKDKQAQLADERVKCAEAELVYARARLEKEKERGHDIKRSLDQTREVTKAANIKSKEERERKKVERTERKENEQKEVTRKTDKKRLRGLANVDLQHEYKQAKKKAKKARKGGNEKEIEEAEAEVQLYKAETKRRRRHKKAKKIRDKVEKKMPVVVDPKELANIEEAMGILGQVEKDEKLNGLGVEQLIGLMKRARETRSKRDDQLVAAIMQLVQVEENAGAKVMKELERLKRKTHKLQEAAFN